MKKLEKQENNPELSEEYLEEILNETGKRMKEYEDKDQTYKNNWYDKLEESQIFFEQMVVHRRDSRWRNSHLEDLASASILTPAAIPTPAKPTAGRKTKKSKKTPVKKLSDDEYSRMVDAEEPELNVETPISYARGLTTKRKKMFTGRGFEPQSASSNYIKFGSKLINMTDLINNNTINLKYEKGHKSIGNYKKTKCTERLKDFIVDAITNGKINETLHKGLDDMENLMFDKLLVVCGLSHYTRYTDEQYKKDRNRYEVLEAELQVNDNPQIMIDMMRLLNKFFVLGKINSEKYHSIVNSLIS
jgi:hypothetical protein